ncbi:MAG: porin [Thermales bacterium]|nr:porin [Thermales bacterium]
MLGLQKQTKLDISSSQKSISSDFLNILRKGAENDTTSTQAFLNGEVISNHNILLGIYAGVDIRNTINTTQYSYNYNTTHNLTAGVSYGIANQNTALAVRTSLNYDLHSNEFYPQINAKGFYNKGNFTVNAGVNLSTNPIYSNPNEVTLNTSYKIPLSKDSQKSITLSGSKQLGIGQNHELYKDQTILGANLRLNRFNIGATYSPKLTENSRSGGSVYANYSNKWGKVFVEGSQNNQDKLLQVGAIINLNKSSNVRANYKIIQDGFNNDTEHVGTLEFNKQF